jgi:Ca2+-binding RTX toxin-like protein
VDGVGGITTFSAVDSLRGYLGDDTFYGGDGGDRFFTERGNDTVYGGDGFDRVRYDRGGVESMDIDLAANIATGIWSGESFVDRLYDVESIRGSYVADEIRGSAADERLEGSGGSDVVDGRFGGDLSIGGADGDLILMGGADADSADGDRDVASGRLSSLNGDTVEQVGAEDAIFVVDAALTDAQVRLVGASLQIDGDGDGAFETVTTVRGPAIAGAVPMLTYTDAVVGREWDEVVSGTYISFAPAAPTPSVAIGEVVQLTAATSWQTLSFAKGYIDPVAFALAPSLNEVEAVATRFRDVTGTGA